MLSAFKPRGELVYLPTFFVISFYPYIESVVGQDAQRGYLIERGSMNAVTSLDADNPDRWAIYLTYGLVKRAYDKLFMSILAEELAHFYMRLKGVSRAAEIADMVAKGRGETEIYKKKEEELECFHLFFDDPVSLYIKEAERRNQPTPQQNREFCEGSEPISQERFLHAILGVDRANNYLKKEAERLANELKLPL